MTNQHLDPIELLQQLVRIPSVNPSLDPDGRGSEEAVAEFAAAWLNQHGVEAWLEPVMSGRPNVVARIGSGEGPTLVLYGHLDTVQVSEMTIPPFEPRIADGRLYGRGAFDMKCGVAGVMTAAAKIAREGGVKGTLLLALVVDEEHSSIGAEAFVAKYKADGCILSEPTNGALVTAHRGFAWLDLRVKGREAHGSQWQVGVSANAWAGRLLAALDDHDQQVLRARVHPDVGPASMHPAIVRGGVGLSTYSPECLIQLEYRSLPGQSAAEIVAEIESIVRAVGADATVTCTLFREALLCPPDARVRQVLVEAIGSEPPLWNTGGWGDSALFAAAGTPALMYGPTGDGAHANVEWVEIDSVRRCAEIYYQAALNFCGGRG